MEESKRHIGFVTSSKQLEQETEEIRKLLGSKKIEWAKLADGAMHDAEQALANVQEAIRAKPFNEFSAWILLARVESTLGRSLLCRLATEVVATHERLAKVEKAITDMRLGAK